jgi:ribosomal-protein-alanine N-acetyltransferase
MSEFELAVVQDTDIGMMSRIHAFSFDEGWTGITIRQILNMPGTFGLVAKHRRRWTVAGFALVRLAADECELLSLAVAPEHRGVGVGGLLFDAAIDRAKISGANKLFLEVAEDNDIARTLYTSRGLLPVGRRPEYYLCKDGSKSAAVTMSCRLKSDANTFPTRL